MESGSFPARTASTCVPPIAESSASTIRCFVLIGGDIEEDELRVRRTQLLFNTAWSRVRRNVRKWQTTKMLDQERLHLGDQLAVWADYDSPPGRGVGGIMSLHGVVRDKSGSVSKELFDYSRS